MSFLLDTNIISAVAPSKPGRSPRLVDWLDQHTEELFLSVVTVAEVRAGIAKSIREGATRKASTLTSWWDSIEHLYASRLIPFDVAAARIAGELSDRARAQGYAPGFADVAIAATAQRHDLTIVTRNTRHFAMLAVSLLNMSDLLET